MNRSGQLTVRAVPIKDLTSSFIEQMWHLYSANYEKVTRENFDRDLSNKTGVFVAEDTGDGSFQGFSTYHLYSQTYLGRTIDVFFSGDTMIAKEYWGQPALHLAFCRTLIWHKLKRPLTPLYWFLICMGYRTYLVMAKNFCGQYWPNYLEETPKWEKGLIHKLAFERFGLGWQPDTGLIDLPKCEAILNQYVAPIEGTVLDIPEVSFLVTKNPTYFRGTELACLAHFTLMIPVRFLWKQFKKSVKHLVSARKENVVL